MRLSAARAQRVSSLALWGGSPHPPSESPGRQGLPTNSSEVADLQRSTELRPGLRTVGPRPGSSAGPQSKNAGRRQAEVGGEEGDPTSRGRHSEGPEGKEPARGGAGPRSAGAGRGSTEAHRAPAGRFNCALKGRSPGTPRGHRQSVHGADVAGKGQQVPILPGETVS